MYTVSIFMDYPLNNSYLIFTYINQSHRDIQTEVSITGHLRGTFPYLGDTAMWQVQILGLCLVS